MTAASPVDLETPSPTPMPKVLTRRFISRRDQPRLTAEQVTRQGLAVTYALRALSSPQAAMAFLNGQHADLGRPLDLAVASQEGLIAVEAFLSQRARDPG